jgi:hypothetical protein
MNGLGFELRCHSDHFQSLLINWIPFTVAVKPTREILCLLFVLVLELSQDGISEPVVCLFVCLLTLGGLVYTYSNDKLEGRRMKLSLPDLRYIITSA